VKLSCLPVSYFPRILGGEMSVRQWAREAVEVGLDAIDLSILFLKSLDDDYLAGLRAEIEQAGARVCMVTTYPDFTHPSEEERKRQLDQLTCDIAAAAQLGGELVRVTAGQAHPETGIEQGIGWAVTGLTRALEAARRHEVRLVYENHARGTGWRYNDFSHPTQIFLAIVERTAGTSLGVNWDTANILAYGDNPLPVLKRVLPRVVSVHAADTSTRGQLTPVLLGTGLVPFRETFAILKKAGFDGWICIEEASFNGRSGIEAAARYIRRIWDEVTPADYPVNTET